MNRAIIQIFQGRRRTDPRSCWCPTCGSAISCAAIRSSSCCGRAIPPAGRCADHDAVRAAARLHAGGAQGHRRRPAAQAAGAEPSTGRWRAAARRALRHGAGDAADLEIGAGAVARRHPGADRLRRRGPLRPAQRHAAGRTATAPHDRPLRRAGAAEGRGPARPNGRGPNSTCRSPMRSPGARSAGCRTTAGRSSPLRPARSARASAGRSPISPSSPAISPRRACGLGAGQPGRGAARRRDRARRRRARARPHLARPAQRHPGAEMRQRLRCRTIPASFMSPPRSARRPSASSGRPARGTGRRSIRSRP